MIAALYMMGNWWLIQNFVQMIHLLKQLVHWLNMPENTMQILGMFVNCLPLFGIYFLLITFGFLIFHILLSISSFKFIIFTVLKNLLFPF